MQTPPAVNQVATPRTAGIAIASLVLGILAVSCLSILAGIPALILGIMTLNKVGQSRGALTGKGFGIAGIVMGGVSFLLLPITAALLLPAVAGARSTAQQAACMNNVRQCTLACVLYAQEHDGTLPKTWDETQPYFGGNLASMAKVLHCKSEAGIAASYGMVQPGKRIAELGEVQSVIIVRELKPNHRGQGAVGFADGHVEIRPLK